MHTTDLIPPARDTLTPHQTPTRTITTITTTPTYHHGIASYDTEHITARYTDGTHTTIDIDNTPLVEALETYADHQAAIYGHLSPLTLRLAPEPANKPPTPLDPRTTLFVISIHARAAANHPHTPPHNILPLADLAFETNETAHTSTWYQESNRHSVRTRTLTRDYQHQAAAHDLPTAQTATPAFLRTTATLAIRNTHRHTTTPLPVAIHLQAGHFGDTPAWRPISGATTRYTDGTTRTDLSYPMPALAAVLDTLAAIEPPAHGDTLTLHL